MIVIAVHISFISNGMQNEMSHCFTPKCTQIRSIFCRISTLIGRLFEVSTV